MPDEKIDFVLIETTGVLWLGALPWRGPESEKGYDTREEAQARAVAVQTHYAARFGGTGGPVLVVQERHVQPIDPEETDAQLTARVLADPTYRRDHGPELPEDHPVAEPHKAAS